MNRRPFLVQLACTAALALSACDRGTGGDAAKPGFKGIDITGAEYARSLSLPDVTGKTRTLADFKGKVTVLFFGYTQCPDVCPSTLTELAEAKKLLGAQAERLQVVFVSVDPERDTPEILKAYMGSFDSGFVALRGSLEQTQATAKEFKVFYAKVPLKSGDGYSMDHTAGSYVFDASARVRLFVRYGAGAAALADDLKILLAQQA